MGIVINEKPKAEPVGPARMRELTPYKVVLVNDENRDDVDVGDIVLRMPGKGGLHFILNATKKVIFTDRTYGPDRPPFRCLRDHTVESITFCRDEDDRPHSDP